MRPLALVGTYGQTFGNFADDLKLKSMAQQDVEKQLKKIEEDNQDKQMDSDDEATKQIP
jgi:hypothetical protein